MPEPQIIRCVACGTMNRVPREKMEQGREAVCGHCKAPLLASSKPVIVTDATFSAQVERCPLPVLLDMWAECCGLCRVSAPVMEELAAEVVGRVRVAAV